MSDKKYTEDDLKKSYNEGLIKGKKEGFDFAGGSQTTAAINFQEEYIKKYDVGLKDIGNTFTSVIKAAGEGFGEGGFFSSDAMRILDEQAQEVANSFGVGRGRMEEFKQLIADSSPELIKLGIDQGKAAENYGKIAEAMGGAASLGTEAIIEMSAAAKVTGQNVETLAAKFREVGVSVYDAGDQMKDVANYARSVGVSVAAVSQGVVSNLGKLNTFNFEGGVNGLAKMAAQASRLGIDMEKVFAKAEELLSPEKAIDMSAALQRLGVTSSALLDPLRAMDMAQNDPAALQNEILNISKEFTKFNEVTGKMEILPGSKRRLREVAEALGMTGEQLAGMSIKAADFDRKMSQIKLPDFAEGSQETKELIASMAQMKGGVATINVKDEKTGEVLLKQVDQLTPEDIEKLKNSQAVQAKSVEELAYDQLTQLQQINTGINGVKAAAAFGKATTEPIEKLYNVMMDTKSTISRDYAGRAQTSDFREAATLIAQPVEDFITSGVRGDEKGMADAGTQILQNLSNFEQEQIKKQQEFFNETMKNIQDNFKGAYGQNNEVKASGEITVKHEVDVKTDAKTANINSEDLKQPLVKALSESSFADQITGLLLKSNAPSAATGGKNQ